MRPVIGEKLTSMVIDSITRGIRELAQPQAKLSLGAQRGLIMAVAALVLFSVCGSFAEGFNDDELAHLHVAYLIGSGQLPYRDFFHQQPPLFHFLSAGFISAVSDRQALLFIAARSCAAMAALAVLSLFWRMTFRKGGTVIAIVGVGVFALARPSDLLFQFRPDPLAIAFALLGASLAIHSGSRNNWKASAAGICIGIGIVITQKVMAIAGAFCVWHTISVVRARRSDVRWESCRALLFLLGMAVPVTILFFWARQIGAAETFFRDVFGPPGYWVARRDWPDYTKEPVLMALPMVTVGLSGAFAAVWRALSRRPEIREGDGLIGVLSLCGIVAMLLTPVPSSQAYLVTTHVWVMICAVRRVIGWTQAAWLTPSEQSMERRSLVAGFILAMLLLTPVNMLIAGVGLALWVALWIKGYRPAGQVGLGGAWLMVCLGLVSFVASFTSAAIRIHRHEVVSQVAAMKEIAHSAPAGSRVLTTWPIFTPGLPHATYHWCTLWEMFRSLPLADLQKEQLAALDDPRVRIVTCDPTFLGSVHPVLMRRIRDEFRALEITTLSMHGTCVFVR